MKDGINWVGPSTSRAWMCLLAAAATGVAAMLASSDLSVHAAGKVEPVEPSAPQDRQEWVNEIMRLTASQLVTVNVDPAPDRNIWTPITIDGQQFTMDLEPHSIRAPGYQLLAQQADGSMLQVDPGPLRTLRGSLDEIPGSKMAASLLEDGLHGSIMMPNGQRWWFEPLLNRIPGAAANEYVLYRSEDVIHPEGTCGTQNDVVAIPDLPDVPMEGAGEGAGGGIAGSTIFCTELACDADFEYFTDYGSNVVTVQNRINQVINQMDLQYINQVDIDHIITAIIVRTAEPDPYASTNAGTLLNEFRNHWLANQAAIPRDVAQLFTGKSLDGSTIGIAFTIGGICTTSAYCLVESDCCGSLACATDLSAHELGHLWAAFHCTAACSSTMNPSITCVNTFLNSNPDSVAAIVAHRNTRPCLSTCADAALPFFDPFPAATIDPAKWSTIVNCLSSTLGTNEPSAPNSLNLRGTTGAGGQIRTSRINSSGVANLLASYQYQQDAGGDDPEAGDNLVVEYFNNVGNWVQVAQHLGSDPALGTFTPVNLSLPADAKHSEFRLRFRNTSPQNNLDDWFVDDVSIIASPVNDNCSAAENVTAGSHSFTTAAASTDGPDESSGCGVGQLNNDVWYRFGPTCAPGTVTVSLCGANFDSRLAVYLISCPGGPGNTIACNDNACGDDAEVSVHVNLAQLLRIRVGGATSTTGSGTMVITCVPDPACDGDVNGDNVVNITDLLAVVAAWGTSDPAADVNNDNVVNITDLLLVIGDWGAC